MKARVTLLTTGAALVLLVFLSLSMGEIFISPADLVRATLRGLSQAPLSPIEHIVLSLRVPRVLVGLAVGAGLGAAGAATQGVFRNPLADPYLLGTASGASLGVTLVLLFSANRRIDNDTGALVPEVAARWVTPGAFLGALAAVLLTFAFSRRGGRDPLTSLLLSGVMVGSMMSALSTFLLLRQGEHLRTVIAWALGNLSFSGWHELSLVLPYVALGIALLAWFGRVLDVLQLGDDTATTLGVRPKRARALVLVLSCLTTGACVAFVGTIGFVGLIAPHLMRRLAFPTHRALVLSSALMGATLLGAADLASRMSTHSMPVGVLLTLLGGPFFLWVLRKT